MIVYGLNPVLEALRAGRVRRLHGRRRADKRIDEALALAQASRRARRACRCAGARRAARGGVHQGIAAEVEAPRDYSVRGARRRGRARRAAARRARRRRGSAQRRRDRAQRRCRRRRTASSARRGTRRRSTASPRRRRPAPSRVVRIATVVNIARALEELKEAGVWTVGFAGEAREATTSSISRCRPRSCVGGEGSGLRRLTRERCDRLRQNPDGGLGRQPECLGGGRVALFEAARQRRLKTRVNNHSHFPVARLTGSADPSTCVRGTRRATNALLSGLA